MTRISPQRRWSVRAAGSARLAAIATAVLLTAQLLIPVGSTALAATPCDPPVVNQVACENSLTGNPSTEWDVVGSGDATIQGFATEISVNRGATISFKINTSASAYRIDIYRIGFYGGAGARRVATISPSVALPQTQPACLSESATRLVDCGNWATSASWAVPGSAVSGVYIARPVRTDTGGASHILFVVRDDLGTSEVVFQTSDTTWQAYNFYGGYSLYRPTTEGRAFKVSYNRPFLNRGDVGTDRNQFFSAEYPMVRWLEANGYDVSYLTGVDSDRFGSLIQRHRVFLSVGHDEYWSGAQRANVEAARGAGVNLAFFSGNEVFWKTRWENSIDPAHSPYRTLVSYKETHANNVIDPAAPVWTGTWRDPRFAPPGDGGRPENALTGTIFTVNGIRHDAITVPYGEGRMRFWRNTSIASLAPGQVATLPTGTLGYEWDEELDNGFRPAGLIRLSSTTVSLPTQYLLDYGSNYGAGTATHRMTLYRTGSALVFGAGTIQWSWGLDARHDGTPTLTDIRMQQATVNLLADMRAQAATPQAGLVAAAASTDTVRPTSVITSPANGAHLTPGTPMTITGTAADSGGVVGAVEVSTDAGRTWHLAAGRETWTYSWTPGAVGSMVTILTRATDDSANLETPGPGVTVTVGSCGVCRGSLSLNGTGAYARASHASELNTVGDWTVETWFRDETPGGYNHDSKYMLIKGDTNSNGEAPYLMGISYNSLFAGQRTGWSNYIINSNIGLLSQTWHHAAATFVASTRRLTLYLDGVQVAQATTGNATARGNMLPVEIGRNGSTGMAWQGKLDDLRIWNVVRSGAEISASYLTELSSVPAGLVANWRFNEGSGTIAADSIGLVRFHDATLFGAAGWSTDVGNTPPPPDTTAPVISAVVASAVTQTAATISWSTNESSDTQVEYGTTTAYGALTVLNSAPVTTHSQAIATLSPSTLYHFRVRSRDAANNLAVSSDFTFTTAAPDVTPPVISAVGASEIAQNVATIGWTTNEPSDTQVEYGTTTSYGALTTLVAAPVAVHSQQLSGLVPSTLYHYRVRSRDTSTNLAMSGDLTFTTAAPDTTAPTIAGLGTSNVTNTAATISWTTNEASDTQIDYGTTTSYGQQTTLAGALITGHTQALTSLTPNTLYHYRVRSRDAANNLALSGDQTFTTTNAPPLFSLALSGSAAAAAQVPHATELNITGNWTVEAWFKDETPGGYNHDFTYIAMKGNSDTNGEAPYVVGVGWNYLFAGGRAGWTNHWLSTPIGNLSANSWHHVAATFVASTRQLTLYLDGAQVAQGAIALSTTTGNALPVEIGRNGSSAGAWRGKIDDVRIWSAARTGSEVAANYRSELSSAPAILVGNWKFNEGSGGTAADNTVTAQNAALLGTASWSNDVGNTPAAPDTSLPVISAVGASAIASGSATIAWTTDEAADTQVDYGTTTGYGQQTSLNASLVTSHSQQLTGLSPSTLYHYRVRSRDGSLNASISGDFTFTTATPDMTPPVISGVGTSGITNTAATIGWTTSEPSDTQIDYGTTAGYGSQTALDPALAAAHSQSLSGLASNTLYHYRVRGRDSAGNLALSDDFTFTTTNAPPAGSLALSGSGAQSAQVPHTSALNITGDWTLEAWFRDETPGGFNHDFAYIVMKGNTDSVGEVPFVLGVQWNRLFAGERTAWSGHYLNSSLGSVSANAWHHASASFVASTRQLTLYLDGVQVAQGMIGAQSNTGNTQAVEIGRNGSGAGAWRGKIDDVRLWNVARSGADIAASYQTELASAPAGLVGNWKFNEGSGTTAADGTVPPENATLIGGAGWSTDIHP